MKREGSHKKLQSSMEYILILSIVIIMALLVSLLVMHNSSNVKLGNTDTLLAVAYFSGANGQPICNATEGQNTCFEILLTQPLPKYPIYNLTYWNNEEQATNGTFEGEQDNYMIWITPPFSNQFYFQFNNTHFYELGLMLDNYYDINYIGQVNGYYEYVMNTSGIGVQQPAFISSLELQYYTPNLNGGSVSNTTYILPIDGKPIPIKMYLNATSLINLAPEQPVQVPNFDNVLSVTEVGLASGSSLSYSETFQNGATTSNSFTIPSNSESTFVISNLTNQLPETLTLSLTGITNGVTVGKETLTTSDNDNVFVNFTQPTPIKLISTTSTVGPFVVTTSRDEQFSNMVVTTGNTFSNGGIPDDAYITNITSNHVEFFIKTPANVIYLNFEGTSQLSPNGPTGESPALSIGVSPNGTYAPYDDGAIVFANYTNFAGPSQVTFGSANPSTQNTIISAFTSGPFSFTANGNQTMIFKINNGLNISEKQNNGYNENLYLPIQNGETYILGGAYSGGDSINIGIANSTDNYYDQHVGAPMWTNGVFARGACDNLYLAYVTSSSNVNSSGCGSQQINFYSNVGMFTTYATYTLNNNSVKIIFPDGTTNKQFIEPLIGPYNFTIETFNYVGEYHYLAETSQPVQMEICRPPYSASNTITCYT